MDPQVSQPSRPIDMFVPDPAADGGFKARAPIGFTGELTMWPTRTAPAGWLKCDGSAISRTIYNDLFRLLINHIGTFSVTIASPGVVTLNAHGLEDGDQVYLITTSALPTGLAANTLYYIKSSTANTFRLSATRGGADINTSGSQSGTHSLYFCPWGLGNGSTTFNVPDMRANVVGGYKSADANFTNLGKTGGEATHLLTTGEMPSHTHAPPAATAFLLTDNSAATASGASWFKPSSSTGATGATGGGGTHNNIQPYNTVNFIIKV